MKLATLISNPLTFSLTFFWTVLLFFIFWISGICFTTQQFIQCIVILYCLTTHDKLLILRTCWSFCHIVDSGFGIRNKIFNVEYYLWCGIFETFSYFDWVRIINFSFFFTLRCTTSSEQGSWWVRIINIFCFTLRCTKSSEQGSRFKCFFSKIIFVRITEPCSD